MFAIFYSFSSEKEILNAAEWYNLQQDGLGERFISELEKLEYYIGLSPYFFPLKYATVRQATMKRFPYIVLFKVEGTNIFILSVFNCYQNPAKKKKSAR